MAASIDGVLDDGLREKVDSAKVLVVGAGGIGCELLKNLVLSGFRDIELIDLDTIDVSNLNRQFLFQKQHVGRSKAKVAQESVLQFNPQAKVKAYHDSITNPEYGVDFFQQFTMVMNALDNRAARNHVNRMCLAANIPLIESGTAGYLGQVTLIKKGVTECYECQPKPTQRTFPGCTIRNTPSEAIHCIVWAKHLFNQLFGEQDPDQDVSPDTEDPEAAGNAGQYAIESKVNDKGNIHRISTHSWANECGYDPIKLFTKLFHDDIKYLLSMDKLWETRRPPTPLDWTKLPNSVPDSTRQNVGMRDQQLWNIEECANVFKDSLQCLKEQVEKLGEGGILVWDKDDDACINFVTSCANIRSHIFGIPQKSKFDVKSMAGNIIPAIATTNAIIAAIIVMQSLKVLIGQLKSCKTVYLNRIPNPKKKLLVPCQLDKPNPKCYVCSAKPEVTIKLNVNTLVVKTLEEKILKDQLNMVAPDVEIDDGKGTILISSEEGETEDNYSKFLSDFSIGHGSRLKCDDFQQSYQLNINIVHSDKLDHGIDFEIIGDVSQLQATSEAALLDKNKNGVSEPKPGTSRESDYHVEDDDDDDLMVIEEEEEEESVVKTSPNGDKMDISEPSGNGYLNNINYDLKDIKSSKRKADSSDDTSNQLNSKKIRISDKSQVS